MGIACAPDIFQAKMSDLMHTLEFIRMYLDDLLCITKGSFNDHLLKVGEVLEKLKSAKLSVNVKKSSFALHEI